MIYGSQGQIEAISLSWSYVLGLSCVHRVDSESNGMLMDGVNGCRPFVSDRSDNSLGLLLSGMLGLVSDNT